MNLLIDFLITNFTLCPSIITYSVVGNDPMLLPQANTQSYYENSKCSPMCPVEFLYWCWGAYLEFDCERYRKIHSQDIDFKSFDSYNIALSQCKWMGTKCPANSMNHLISPQVDLHPICLVQMHQLSSLQAQQQIHCVMMLVTLSRSCRKRTEGRCQPMFHILN